MTAISSNSIEELRKVLEVTQGKPYSSEEARKIGKWLLRFYVHLDANKRGISFTPDGNPKVKTDTKPILPRI